MVDTSAASGGLVPAIRFEGFSGEWEEVSLEEFGAATSGTSIESEFSANGKYKVISIGSYSEKSEYTDQGIRAGLSEKTQKRILNKNDLTMILNDKTLAGNIIGRVLLINENDSFIYNQRTQRIEPYPEKYKPQFIYQLLNAPLIRSKIVKSSQGNTQIYVNWSSIKKLRYTIPKKSEQTKIGQYFQQLDTLIAQHQQKHDKLLNLKKSLLEKMFPKQGEDEPAIRFKGFSGAWEEKMLGDILDISSAARVHKDEWTDTGVPFFRTSDVVAKYKGLDNTKAFISFELYKKLSNKIGYVKKDDLLITGGGSIGVPYLIKTSSPLYFKDADLLWLKNNSAINGYFLFVFFFSQVFRKHISSITHIGTISHYTIEQAKSTPISISANEEQTKIGKLFQQLDTLITQHQTQLKKLTNIKQACLAKLFV